MSRAPDQPWDGLSLLRVEKGRGRQQDHGRGAVQGCKTLLGEQEMFEITRHHIIKKVISPRLSREVSPNAGSRHLHPFRCPRSKSRKEIKTSQEIKLRTYKHAIRMTSRELIPGFQHSTAIQVIDIQLTVQWTFR